MLSKHNSSSKLRYLSKYLNFYHTKVNVTLVITKNKEFDEIINR